MRCDKKTFREIVAWLEDHGAEVSPSKFPEPSAFIRARGDDFDFFHMNGRGIATTSAGRFLVNRFIYGGEIPDQTPGKSRKGNKIKGGAGPVFRQIIANRDGETCAFCGDPVNLDTASLKMMLPKREGGNHSPHNLALSCPQCSITVGAAPIAMKISFAVLVRQMSRTEAIATWLEETGQLDRLDRFNANRRDEE